MSNQVSNRSNRARSWFLALALVCAALTLPAVAQSQLPDLCGCRNYPTSLGAFDTRVPSTWPAGTSVSLRTMTIPLPADGVLVFDSINLEWATVTTPGFCCNVDVTFAHNAANTPITILVKGNVTITGSGDFTVKGNDGASGTTANFGAGGIGGHGGYRGGDGAFRLQNLASDGGAGLGPSGGVGATASPQTGAGAGGFIGATDLLPLVGGSGGGGGRSTNAVTTCSGGGGGGGGGAILIVANGTITLNNTSNSIIANGGNGGGHTGSPCASGGAGGGGGAIRLVANTIAGSGRLSARGGVRFEDAAQAASGAIRLEAVNNSLGVTLADPVASRSTTPGPIVNPFTPTVAVTAVGGRPVPAVPQGVFGAIDVQVPVPGPSAIDLQTDGVPSGTTVQVMVKPRVGAAAVSQNVTLTNCDAQSRCLASATFDLAAGTYAVEARATFQAGL